MEYRTRKIIKPGDLNPHNTLFGGRLIEWIDEECAIYASCQLNTASVVTKFIGQIDFRNPAHQGDVIEIGVETVRIGDTSITLCCEVRNKTTKQFICNIREIVFVHVDKSGRAAPHGMGLMNFEEFTQVVS